MPISWKAVRVISLDITGTILQFRYPISKVYAEACQLSGLPHPPSADDIKIPFQTAYKQQLESFPVFGYSHHLSERQWWYNTVKLTLDITQRQRRERFYSDEEMEKCFRRIYQYYGKKDAYSVYPDAMRWINRCKSSSLSFHPTLLVITTNSPRRTIETVIPSLDLDQYFDWYISCKDVGAMKPNPVIWDKLYKSALHYIPNLKRSEIVHIGDDFKADYEGAKTAGFQSLYLNRNKQANNDINNSLFYEEMIISFDDILITS